MVFQTILFMSLVASLTGETFDAEDAAAKECYDCVNAIICDAREVYELRPYLETGKIIEKGLRWLNEVTDLKTEDTPEFWHRNMDVECSFSEERKEQLFTDLTEKLVDYWVNVCKDEASIECIALAVAEKEWLRIQAKYTKEGVCKMVGETTAEQGQGFMEDGKSKMKSGMPF